MHVWTACVSVCVCRDWLLKTRGVGQPANPVILSKQEWEESSLWFLRPGGLSPSEASSARWNVKAFLFFSTKWTRLIWPHCFWHARSNTWSTGMREVTCVRLSAYDIIQVHVGSSSDELLSDLQVALLCCHHQGSLSILAGEEENRLNKKTVNWPGNPSRFDK